MSKSVDNVQSLKATCNKTTNQALCLLPLQIALTVGNEDQEMILT